MNRVLLLIVISAVIAGSLYSQVTLASWDFQNSTKISSITDYATFNSNPYTADNGISGNINVATIKASVASSSTLAWGGTSPNSLPSLNTWDSGANTKYWYVQFSTYGYDSITLSSKQQSSSTGPKEFKVQYSTDGSTWTDTGNSVAVANNLTSGVLTNESLPIGCVNQSTLYLRWIMTSNVSVGGGVVSNGGTSRIDDVIVNGLEISSGNASPTITTPSILPSTDITSTTPVTVSATITDSDGTVAAAAVYWGTISGSRTNDVDMTASGDTWSATIPAQADGTTVYYSVYAIDDDADDSESAEQSYTVNNPATTTIPYVQNFNSGFGEIYSYNVSGTKPWYIYSNDTATCNGYLGSLEEHWLVLPGINFDSYTSERMTFITNATYGTIDANNYLKLFYSSNYPGLGDPSSYTWAEVAFANGGIGGGETPSGVLDLTGISGSNVYLAFKYLSSSSSTATKWEVDDINIYLATPSITVSPSSLIGFTYAHQSGPSAEQSFNISGSDLIANVSIDAPTNYEISTGTGASFVATDPITLTQNSGVVAATPIYVRLKANLAIGNYNGETITATSTNATDKTVTCSGSVTTPAAPAAPVATAATSVGSDSFAANWNSVSGAAGYYLDVYSQAAGTNASDLFISEYVEGSSYNKAIEIYNGTGAPVDLANYILKKQTNGAGLFKDDLALSGTLANNDVYVIAYNANTPNLSGNAYVDLSTNSNAVNYSGNDAVALYNGTNQIDVVGVVNQVADWGKDVTLVRKATANVPTVSYNVSDWNSYPQDTFAYLGSHTFSGGVTKTYVTGYENKDVSDVTSYSVTGLDPATTYYYVVRAYDNYGQTSGNSNEITSVTSAYDYPEDQDVAVNGVTITITNGNGNNSSTSTTTAPNANFVASFAQVITLIGNGPWSIILAAPMETVPWFAYRRGTTWTSLANTTGSVSFDIPAAKDAEIEIQGGSGQDPTLPVELSSFTAIINSQNLVNIQWISQSESNLNGYYIQRSSSDQLSEAVQVSPLIHATNTSQQQVYVYTDSELQESGTYYYWLEVQEMDGTMTFHGPRLVVYNAGGNPGTPNVPLLTELKSVYPNPFNPSATIQYALAKEAAVKLTIYNARGQIVRSFYEGDKASGTYNVIWNGTDNYGRECGTGIYYIRMQAGAESFMQKAVLMK